MTRKTSIELVILAALFLGVLALWASRPYTTLAHARAAVLKSDVAEMRKAIENYTVDNQKAPQSLNELVVNNYLREIPTDPITRRKDWVLHLGNATLEKGSTTFGIIDVSSKSEQPNR